MSEDTDLSFVSTEDLIAEIMRRHAAVLVVREIAPIDSERDTIYDYGGGASTCLGLAIRAQQHILKICAKASDDAEASE